MSGQSIIILTLADADYREIGAISGLNKERYAATHGYDFHCQKALMDVTRSAEWNKIPLIQHYLPLYRWIMWTDADSLVMNGQVRLESIIDSAPPTADLIICQDHNGLNSGEFLLRNSVWSFAFLEAVRRQTEYLTHPWREQAAMIEVLKPFEQAPHIHYVAQRVLNAYNIPGGYQDGDFLLHFVGMNGRRRQLLSLMRKFARRAQF